MRSFVVESPDPTKFTDITVNYTIADRHALTEGFVARMGLIDEEGNVTTIISYGEGNNWRQNELLSPVWKPTNNHVWEENQREILRGLGVEEENEEVFGADSP